jgi:hypothetical protein
MSRIAIYLNLGLALLFLALPASLLQAKTVNIAGKFTMGLPDNFVIVPPEEFAEFGIYKDAVDWAARGYYQNIKFEVWVDFFKGQTQAQVNGIFEDLKNRGVTAAILKIDSLSAVVIDYSTYKQNGIFFSLFNGEKSFHVAFATDSRYGETIIKEKIMPFAQGMVSSIIFSENYKNAPTVTPVRSDSTPRPSSPARPPNPPARPDDEIDERVKQLMEDLMS